MMLNSGKADRAATVVPFRSRPSIERRDAGMAEGRGEILLFTGIRYERMEDPDDVAAAAIRDAADRRPEAEC